MAKRLLLKAGTAVLMANGRIDQAIFDQIARQVCEVKRLGFCVAIVTSGAIKCGEEEARELGIDASLLHKKDLAGIGSARLIHLWREAFEKYKIGVAQVWVTHSNLQNRAERKSIKQSSDNFAFAGIVPVLNENDVVSPREISLMSRGISENDHLQRLYADLFRPDLIANLTLAGGIFEADPAAHPGARMYRELDCQHLPRQILLRNGKSEVGNGGAGKKIKEMALCCFKHHFLGWRWGRNLRIVRIIGLADDAIVRFAQGEEIGTLLGRKNLF